MKQKILVTGGAGFIASHIVDRLVEAGYRVILLDNLSTGRKEHINSKAKFYRTNIQSPWISEIFRREKPQSVFHYAAHIDVREALRDPVRDARENILGSLNILENCKIQKVQRIVFASTGGAMYGEAKVIPTPETYEARPLSPYGVSKLAVEQYLWYYFYVFHMPFVALRLANVYGPRQSAKGEAGVVAIFTAQMLKDKQPIVYGTGNQTRDFVFVEDVVQANIKALQSSKVGVFNIGTGKETSVNEIFSQVKKLTGSSAKKMKKPKRTGEQKRSCLNIERAKKELTWEPHSKLQEGLRKTIEWYARGSL